MNRNDNVQKMTEEEVCFWYKKIKPIVTSDWKLVYYRPLQREELFEHDISCMLCVLYNLEVVNFQELSVLADIKMTHEISDRVVFNHTFEQIVSQIPTEMLEKAKAFQIVYEPHGKADYKLFHEEYQKGMHVSVVRVYSNRNNFKGSTKGFQGIYPDKEATLPIGMSEEEYEKLKVLMEKRYR